MTDRAVEALKALIGEGRKRRQEVADVLDVNEQSLYQIVAGIPLKSGKPRGVGRELREKLDANFPNWEKLPTSSEGVAHDLSQARNYPATEMVLWGELMTADLSRPFELDVVDGSFGTDIPVGAVMRLDPKREPRAGWPLLVRDKQGRHYLRDYQQGAGDRWQAVARVRGFAPLDSLDDGLTIIAVMKGVDFP